MTDLPPKEFGATDDLEGIENKSGRVHAAPDTGGGLFARFRREPLLPEAGAGGAPLTAVIAVISFLAAVALAAFLLINSAASTWTSALRSELTVQVKGADTAEIETGAQAAMRILLDTEGVIEARRLSSAETSALLEPWLGKENASSFLTIPALIEVRAGPDLKNNLDLLRNRLSAAAPNATLDDHGGWHERLDAAAESAQILALFVFLLVIGAACATSIFAARAGLAANQEIVSVLHLVGATDRFIANEVQRRFWALGLRGSSVGVIAAVILLGVGAIALRGAPGAGAFLPSFELSGWVLFWLLTVPAITSFVTAFTARQTVLNTLTAQY
ncbi:MAG: hypothetical protein AAGB02_05540 [Pseudomonadota bacterium]